MTDLTQNAVLTDLFNMEPTEKDEIRAEKHRQRETNMNDYIKLLAFVTMLIDHVAYYYILPQEWLRALGRMSAPLYLFMSGWHLSTEITPKLTMSMIITTWMHYTLESRMFPVDILFSVAIVRMLIRFVLPKVQWPLTQKDAKKLKSGETTAMPSSEESEKKDEAKSASHEENKSGPRNRGEQNTKMGVRGGKASSAKDSPPSILIAPPSGERAYYRLTYMFPTLVCGLILAFLFFNNNICLLDYDWTGVLFAILGAHARLSARVYRETCGGTSDQKSYSSSEHPKTILNCVKGLFVDVSWMNTKSTAVQSTGSQSYILSQAQAQINILSTALSIMILAASHYYIYQTNFAFEGLSTTLHRISITIATALIMWVIASKSVRVESAPKTLKDEGAKQNKAYSNNLRRRDLFSQFFAGASKVIGYLAKFTTIYSLELYVVHLLIIFLTMPSV